MLRISKFSRTLLINQINQVANIINLILISNLINGDNNFPILALMLIFINLIMLLSTFYDLRIRTRFENEDKRLEIRAKRLFWNQLKGPPISSPSDVPMLITLFLLVLFAERAGLSSTQVAILVLIVYSLVMFARTSIYILYPKKSKPWFDNINFENRP